MTLHLSATHVKTEFTWCSEKWSLFLIYFCSVLVCGMSVLKILCLIMVDVIQNVYCNVSRNTFYLLYSKVFFAQIFKVPSLSRLLFHCSLCGTDLQVTAILGKIPPLPPASPLVVRTILSKFLTRKDTWSCWPLLFVTALPWTTLFYEFVIVFLMTMFILPVVVSCTQTFVTNWCLSNLRVKTHCADYSMNKWIWLCNISSLVHWIHSLAFPLTHTLLWDLCVSYLEQQSCIPWVWALKLGQLFQVHNHCQKAF